MPELHAGTCFCRTPDSQSLAVSQWPDVHLPWGLTDLLPGMTEAEMVADIEWGLGQWAKVCGLKPVQVQSASKARLLIGVRRIDGASGILGETYLPGQGVKQVRMWLDVSEAWTSALTADQRRVILPLVVWHEGGHAIGLGHAPDRSPNVMAPVYNPAVTSAGPWDIAQAQARYGPPVQAPAPLPPTTPSVPSPVPLPGGQSVTWQAILNALSGLAAQPWFQEFGHELMQWLLQQFLGTLPVTPQRLHALVDEFKATKGIA